LVSLFLFVTLFSFVLSSPSLVVVGREDLGASVTSADVADLRLQALGLAPSRFSGANLFSGPRVGLTVAISGFVQPTGELQALKQAGLTTIDVPAADATSELAYILHGTAEGFRRATTPDVVSQTYNGNSLTVAMSFDHELAELLAVDASLVNAESNNYAFAWNTKTQSFENLFGNQNVQLSSELAKEADWLQSTGAKLSSDGKSLSFGSEKFELTSQADKHFVVELLTAVQLTRMTTDTFASLVSDSSADSFSFALTGLEQIRRQYGSKSARYEAAAQLLDRTLVLMSKTLEQAYGSQVDTQFILLDDSMTVLPRFARSLQLMDSSNTTTNYTFQQVASYQLCLWTSVLLFVAILLTFLMTHCMEINKDSILYRSTQSINFS